mmetsp:Transcript_23744/g.33204  ORF Transcript_23744/g.33204 Transcript_23744/m.33204 type:complete len:261 (+) Transcript_23744:121-903(+)|eukprot:CAMPEP_0184479146 /NCGR_PEP_ID=MMETSP0113_2-20130426/980_1 /TAXON_ID=91329 /ORGANISM="Norrisiella sphaerica, Strain BC52" /LENGTH=260 /DNA_ID=CAMNT_0026857163 /DNA_START=121 /DNA_END=903 /DNA_ORIENTATION=+
MATVFDTRDQYALRFAFENFVTDQMRQRREKLQEAIGQICRFYQKGTCMKGTACEFKHSRQDRTVVCKHWLRGLCKKADRCDYLHEYDMSKMQPCHFFINDGECNNRDCYFLHLRPEDRVKDCPWYDSGFCRHGSKCRNRHRRRVACPDYLAGFCLKGPECPYGHPKFMLSTSSADPSGTSITCNQCGKKGHLAGSCPEVIAGNIRGRKFRPLEQVRCFKCGQMGHYANMCTNERAKPPPGGWALPGMQKRQQGQPMQQD